MNKKIVHSQAFTLVELLVVVTIIAVLASLLLPALAAAKNRAKTAQCVNNQRQMSAGWSGYLSDHNGYYPYQGPISALESNNGSAYWDSTSGQLTETTYGWPTSQIWYYIFAPYVNGLGVDQYGNGPFTPSFYKVLRCPANPWPTSSYNNTNEYYNGMATLNYVGLSPSSYSLNYELIPTTFALPQGGNLLYDNPDGWTKRANMNDIHHPASAAMMLENPVEPYLINKNDGFHVDNPWTRLNGANSWLSNQPMPAPGGAGISGGLGPYCVTNMFNTPDGRFQLVWLRPDCNYGVATFHNLGMNVLFFDGHVARVTKGELLSYSAQALTGSYQWLSASPDTSPGGMFWTDGFGGLSVDSNGGESGSKYRNQFPGTNVYP